MKYFIVVVFFQLLASPCLANDLNQSLQLIESEWSVIYYDRPEHEQQKAYQRLAAETQQLTKRFPNRAEPIILLAIITATQAGTQTGLSGLSLVYEARDLLLQAISMDPYAFDGAAFTNLGTLYYRVPGWPIAFGNTKKAREMFLIALKINPDSIDVNYYYGDFLLSQNKPFEAANFFMRAIEAPTRPEQNYADSKLQDQARSALDTALQRKLSVLKQLKNFIISK